MEPHAHRTKWLDIIASQAHASFSDASTRIHELIMEERAETAGKNTFAHLRTCGHIPESYGHDTTEEKLYSKYTDSVISCAFSELGFRSRVLTERADAADVVAREERFSFAADAKAFRLSRTAKNQKDFKVQAMDGWRNDNDYAMVVCPIYQLPKNQSQIYLQAITRDVCLFTYSHLLLLVMHAQSASSLEARTLLKEILEGIKELPPSKSCDQYWGYINNILRSNVDRETYATAMDAERCAVERARQEGIQFYKSEIARYRAMSKEQLIIELEKSSKINSRITTIENVKDNGIISI